MIGAVAGAVTTVAWATNDLLAQGTTPTPKGNPNSNGAEFGKAAPLALVIILLLMVALVLLIRSMNGHVRKLPESFTSTTGDGSSTDTVDQSPAARSLTDDA
ncbi:MAG: hypothetical protein ABI181_13955 [Mycobacteriaceae bacterium]